MVCPPLPSQDAPGGMAPTLRQFNSLREAGVELEIVEMRGIPKLKYMQRLPRIRRLARNADLVHAHYGYCGLLARAQWKRPVVVSFMGSDVNGSMRDGQFAGIRSHCESWVNRKLTSRLASTVIVKSAAMAEALSPIQSYVIPNGVDLELFRPSERRTARTELGFAHDQKLVLFPGCPQRPNKGFALAEEVVAQLRQSQFPNIKLVELWNIAPRDVPRYLNACDVMLLASLAEGSPNVVKEAMACNLPVVASPVGDVKELLGGVPGNKICDRTVMAMTDAIANLLRQEIPSRGRERIQDLGLSLREVALKVMHVYRTVLDGTQPSKIDLARRNVAVRGAENV